MTENTESVLSRMLAFAPSRRAALGGGIAALAVVSRDLAAAQEATPGAEAAAGPVVVQSFGHGTLFQTQGDAPDLPPYTLILWDVAPAGLLFADRASGTAGVIPTDDVLHGLSDTAPAIAALVAHPDEASSTARGDMVWVLELAMGNEGSDPGAVTYLGFVHDDSRAAKAFEIDLTAAPASQNFGPGYLIFTHVPDLDVDSEGVVKLTVG